MSSSERCQIKIILDNIVWDYYVPLWKIDRLQREFGAVATEMEGAAVGYTCYLNDVPFIIIRTISDTGGSQATDDFERYLKVASENSFKIVSTMLRVISYRDVAATDKE